LLGRGEQGSGLGRSIGGVVGWAEQGSGVGQARRTVVEAAGGPDGVFAVAGVHDLPVVVVDPGVTAPTQRYEVVQVGAAAPSEGVHVMGVHYVLVGLAAAGAAAV